MLASVAAVPLAAGLLLVGLISILAGLATGPSLAVVVAVCGLADLAPIALACRLRSTYAFAMGWLAGALLRLPFGFMLASVFRADGAVIDALPIVYLLSLLLSVAVAGMILRAYEEVAVR